jgi:hypothetical protein
VGAGEANHELRFLMLDCGVRSSEEPMQKVEPELRFIAPMASPTRKVTGHSALSDIRRISGFAI